MATRRFMMVIAPHNLRWQRLLNYVLESYCEANSDELIIYTVRERTYFCSAVADMTTNGLERAPTSAYYQSVKKTSIAVTPLK